jgi:hypothetical protein
MDLGFDSLMAVQLRGQLSDGLHLEKALPATLMFDYPTIDSIAEYLLARLEPDRGASSAASVASPLTLPDSPVDPKRAAEVAAMSDEEIEALLVKRMEES